MKLFPKIIGIGLVGLLVAGIISGISIYTGMKLSGIQAEEGKYRTFQSELTRAMTAHLNWLRNIDDAIHEEKAEFTIVIDGKLCAFGKWYYSDETKASILTMPEDFQKAFKNIDEDHLSIHRLGGDLLAIWSKDDLKPAKDLFIGKVVPTGKQVLTDLTAMDDLCVAKIAEIRKEGDWLLKNQSMPVVITLLVGILILVAYSWFTASGIIVSVRKITKAATDLADGNLDVDVQVRTKDETAILATAFTNLAHSLKGKTDVALAIAQGDLTVWVPLSSDADRLGKCLVRMRYSLYDSIKDLKGLAESIGEEASSLTQVNQTLVGNSTHSAEQLKEISGSISSLHTQTEQNANSARDAESLTKSAMDGSNDGREKMGRMVQAMETITRGSDEIKKIIRVIDDIAFQTNLLALNAAVEAARAGQHGKGFAVVAEEVRNLAARSAKAAKETAVLIEESIRQVGLGSGVARETSDSLNVITDQVEKINKIVSTISEESDQQAKHLGGMTDTVGQVSAGADATMLSVTDVSNVIASVNKTVGELDEIVKHFKSNPGGMVMEPGKTYPGFIPGHGAFRNL